MAAFGEVTQTDVEPTLNRCASVASGPRPTYSPASEHAIEFLRWLQGPGGLTGWVSAEELTLCYEDMVREQGLQPHGWCAIGRELRRLVPQPKRYVGRVRTRMWHIPAPSPSTSAAGA